MEKRKDNVIGFGEVTGHTHCANGPSVEVFGDEREMELNAPQGCNVTHEEHKLIEIPAGKYNVGGVLEYDPAAEEARRVQD
jgi:hypothetical protein